MDVSVTSLSQRAAILCSSTGRQCLSMFLSIYFVPLRKSEVNSVNFAHLKYDTNFLIILKVVWRSSSPDFLRIYQSFSLDTQGVKQCCVYT